MDDEELNDEKDRFDPLDDRLLYSDSPWKGISCLSYFWPYTGTEEIFEVRRAISNCTHGLRRTRESTSPFAGLNGDKVEVADMLQFVGAANSILKAADFALDEVVTEAIARGATWAQIGEVLGVRRTAAHKRFSRGISERRRYEIEREGIACMVLYATWTGQIPESNFGFDEDDWESAPIEVFIDHAIRNAMRVIDMFVEAVKSGSDDDGEFEHFKDDLYRAYDTLRRSVHVLSLPRCLPVILRYSLEDMGENPWLDTNASVYYIEYVTRLTLAFQHFGKLFHSFEDDDEGVAFHRQVAYVYSNLLAASTIMIRPELVNVIARIEHEIVESGNSVFVRGDRSGWVESASIMDLVKLFWKKDYKKVAAMIGVDDIGPAPTLDELLNEVTEADQEG
jgi:hypothetical protein